MRKIIIWLYKHLLDSYGLKSCEQNDSLKDTKPTLVVWIYVIRLHDQVHINIMLLLSVLLTTMMTSLHHVIASDRTGKLIINIVVQ